MIVLSIKRIFSKSGASDLLSMPNCWMYKYLPCFCIFYCIILNVLSIWYEHRVEIPVMLMISQFIKVHLFCITESEQLFSRPVFLLDQNY